MSLTNKFKQNFTKHNEADLSIDEYLQLCKDNPLAYATAHERMLAAIGEPEFINTADDSRLSRIFQNRVIARYPAFKEFYGMEDAIERIVSYFKHAAQGLEEKKQVLYLLGPVGGGKSSLAERLKELMQKHPIYVIVDEDGKICPSYESPLNLFNANDFADEFQEEYGIDKRYLTGIYGPWVQKRVREYEGDINRFKVRKIYPSVLEQVAISKTEPGDENNQDISTLVGKVDIRKLERFSQSDADAYDYSGGLCKTSQGMLEFVEMFKAPIKVLHPLLTATQEGNFMGTEAISAMPFNGMVVAHSNESEWDTFKNNKNNEAFLDRIYIVKVPYCLRVTEEKKIYEKIIKAGALKQAPIAPYTLEMLAQFMVLTRLAPTENSAPYTKLRVYDGENVKKLGTGAKPYGEYREDAGIDEGMNGMSTRSAYKIISRVFNFDATEVAANPIHLMYVLQKVIDEGQFDADTTTRYEYFLQNVLHANYKETVKKEIQTAFFESYSEYGQNLFDRYVAHAQAWLRENDFRDPDTGEKFDREALDEECAKIELTAGVGNAKEFRNEVVMYALDYKANKGESPSWTAYEPIKEAIQAKMFSSIGNMLPVISFASKRSKDEEEKHDAFVQRMMKQGYTKKQVHLLVEWFIRVDKQG